MTLDPNHAFALYFDGEEAHDQGDLGGAITAWDELVALLDQHELEVLQSVHGSLPRAGVRRNLAIICQITRQWARMRQYAEALVDESPTAGSLQLLATALKNDGDPQRAREVIERAVALDPGCANAHHEHACILAAAGDLEAALHAMERAIAAGASPQSLLDDDELAMMKDVPGFERVVSTERQVEALLARLGELSAQLGTFRGDGLGSTLSDDEVDTFDRALEVTRALLDTTFATGTPRDPQGRLILGSCSALQRTVIEALLAYEPLWKAIPFLNLIGEIGVPNTSPRDAARALLGNPG